MLAGVICGFGTTRLIAAAPSTMPAPLDPPRVEINPMMAEVGSPPELGEAMSRVRYANRYAAALQVVGPLPTGEASPVAGARVTSVLSDSPAAASLHVDDVIISVDGKSTPSAEAFEAARSAATADQIVEVIPIDDSAHRLLSFKPGWMGVTAEDAWLLEGVYLNSLGPGQAAVDEVRVAARFAVSDPDLAVSALIHAKKNGGAGVGGPVFDAIAAVALYNDDRFEEALAYARAAAKGLGVDSQAQMNPIIADSAIATFRFPLAVAIARQDDRYSAGLSAMLANIAMFEQQKHTLPEPNPMAANLAYVDRTERAVNLAPRVNSEFENSQYHVASMIKRHSIPFTSPDGQYNVCICGPGDTNAAFSARCHFAASDKGHSGYVKVVRIGMESGGLPVETLELNLDGTADLTDNVESPYPKLNLKTRIGHNRVFEVAMFVVGDRCECTLDGRRIFYGPVSASPPIKSRKLTLAIQTVGVAGEFTRVDWRTAGP